jgi:hypothetical protein
MKNRILLGAALFIGAVAFAQTQPTTTPDPNQPAKTTTPVAATVVADVNTTAYVAYPDQLKGLKSEALTPQHFFPALGTYKASGSSTGDVTISLDETNKGIVWVEGLSQGKFKAVMKKAPSTYKIPAQTTESGKAVPEGTLFFNPTTKELTVLLGRQFDDADPTSFLTIPTKTKSKVWQYNGVKADVTTAVEPASQQ